MANLVDKYKKNAKIIKLEIVGNFYVSEGGYYDDADDEDNTYYSVDDGSNSSDSEYAENLGLTYDEYYKKAQEYGGYIEYAGEIDYEDMYIIFDNRSDCQRFIDEYLKKL